LGQPKLRLWHLLSRYAAAHLGAAGASEARHQRAQADVPGKTASPRRAPPRRGRLVASRRDVSRTGPPDTCNATTGSPSPKVLVLSKQTLTFAMKVLRYSPKTKAQRQSVPSAEKCGTVREVTPPYVRRGESQLAVETIPFSRPPSCGRRALSSLQRLAGRHHDCSSSLARLPPPR
jgi:hypothetical protein